MDKFAAIVIGGGATGVGILRDLSMRGIPTLLIEQKDLAYGTSSRYHGLLHSGGRYAVKDAEAGAECIKENEIMRRIGIYCVEATEGFFVQTPEDDPAFETKWVESCKKVNIPVTQLSVKEALLLEPNLNPNIKAVYRVPDAAIDGFRLMWQNVSSARKYGGKVKTYCKVTDILKTNGKITGIKIHNMITNQDETIECSVIVSAAGSWAGEIAALAGINVHVQPDRGTLLAFNHRMTSRVINRLRPAADGDIFVPHGSITIFGTTSSEAKEPDDTLPSTEEIIKLLELGEKMIPHLDNYRLLRAFTGTRPLYSADPSAKGRGASRNFVILDHGKDGVAGFYSIVGGKLTTYRLMAEKMTDAVCQYLNNSNPCRTAEEPLVESPDDAELSTAKKLFPAYGATLAAARLGKDGLKSVLTTISTDPYKKQIVCECENVTLAELEQAAKDPTSFCLSDIRRKTRMGMGTCQGAFCTFRSVGAVNNLNLSWGNDINDLFCEFLEARYRGIRPLLWGRALRETELTRAIYEDSFNLNGVISHDL